MFQNIEKKYNEKPQSILHVAQSLFHDHVPAKHFDMTTVWIDRQNLNNGGNWGATKVVGNLPKPDVIFKDLISFAEETAKN